MNYVEVVFPVSAPGAYTYSLPVSAGARPEIGTRVLAELGRKKLHGFVTAHPVTPPKGTLKEILLCDQGFPGLPPEFVRFLLWLSDYYLAQPGDVFRMALPKAIEQAVTRPPVSALGLKTGAQTPLPGFAGLSPEQAKAFDAVMAGMEAGRPAAFLLHGVTGSGKSHVYYALAAEALRRGRSVLVLVPEISLTPQTVRNFTERFGEAVAVYHSGLSQKERAQAWLDIRHGRKRLVVGVRSALFTPLTNIGLVVVDEEHDSSFSQSEQSFNYNARDAALVRARLSGAVTVLGSATPSIESRYNAENGKYHLLTLRERFNRHALPKVFPVDMRNERRDGNWSLFSRLLLRKLKERFERGEQVILLKNRRGFAHFVLCAECGHVPRCPHCQVSLTYHRAMGRLVCHYCDQRDPVPVKCPECGSGRLQFSGSGVEKVEEELKKAFPLVRALRLDLDTGSRKGRVEAILDAFRRKEADVLIGTQMVSKGLDFPDVTLVGIVLADTGMNLPDYHAPERTFQLLTQVAGRSGRGERAGEVVLQTYSPESPAVRFALTHDYAAFYAEELQARRELEFPPFRRGVLVRFLSKDTDAGERESRAFAALLPVLPGLERLGPAPSPLAKLRGYFRYFLYLRSASSSQLHDALRTALTARGRGSRKTRLQIVFDPDSML
ncbi:MAG: primosomal protein N' [Fibrobacterota bacterium]